MFGLFKSEPVRDVQLGELRRSGGHWKGSLELVPCGTFRLSLAGSRKAPDLFEHYAPYKEAVDEGEQTGSPCPNVAGPEGVWPYVTPAHVLIEPMRLGDSPTVEIAFRVEWDVEHTVAAMYRDWQFVELNGSVRGQ